MCWRGPADPCSHPFLRAGGEWQRIFGPRSLRALRGEGLGGELGATGSMGGQGRDVGAEVSVAHSSSKVTLRVESNLPSPPPQCRTTMAWGGLTLQSPQITELSPALHCRSLPARRAFPKEVREGRRSNLLGSASPPLQRDGWEPEPWRCFCSAPVAAFKGLANGGNKKGNCFRPRLWMPHPVSTLFSAPLFCWVLLLLQSSRVARGEPLVFTAHPGRGLCPGCWGIILIRQLCPPPHPLTALYISCLLRPGQLTKSN